MTHRLADPFFVASRDNGRWAASVNRMSLPYHSCTFASRRRTSLFSFPPPARIHLMNLIRQRLWTRSWSKSRRRSPRASCNNCCCNFDTACRPFRLRPLWLVFGMLFASATTRAGASSSWKTRSITTLTDAPPFTQNRIEALCVRNRFIENQRDCDRFKTCQDPKAHRKII